MNFLSMAAHKLGGILQDKLHSPDTMMGRMIGPAADAQSAQMGQMGAPAGAMDMSQPNVMQEAHRTAVQTPAAPADWRMSADQAARVQGDSRLRGMTRDQLYTVFNNAPIPGGSQPQTTGGAVQGAAHNAMDWHPANMFRYIAERLKEAVGGGQ